MKKTMVIAIFVIYILSIVAVNFFGLQIRNFDGKLYVTHIEYELSLPIREEDNEFTDINDVLDATRVYRTFNFVPGEYDMDNLDENPNAVLIMPHVYPDDADEKEVAYEYDPSGEEKGRFYFDHATGTVYFFKGTKALTISIKATDGSGVFTTVTILPRNS